MTGAADLLAAEEVGGGIPQGLALASLDFSCAASICCICSICIFLRSFCDIFGAVAVWPPPPPPPSRLADMDMPRLRFETWFRAEVASCMMSLRFFFEPVTTEDEGEE